MATLAPILDRWRLTAFLASAGMLAIAHAFQTFGGLAPCLLCLRQREVYWVALAIALAGMLITRMQGGGRWRGPFALLLGLVFLAGAGVAAYHAGAEWKFWPGPTACAATAGPLTADSMSAILQGETLEIPRCDEAPWVFLGLSMAGWNVLISLGLAALSVAAFLRERAKS